jgi:hypothetical protein
MIIAEMELKTLKLNRLKETDAGLQNNLLS